MKAVAVALLTIVLAAGCGAPGPAKAASHPTPSGSSVSTVAPVASGPRLASPPPQSSTTLADESFPLFVTFNCKLPGQLMGGQDAGAVPGFLDLSTGRFVSDPAAELTKVPNSWDDWRTVATPVLRGFTGITYSRAARRWIPADRLQVSPDGVHYAYPEVPSPNVDLHLHVVDLAAGTDTVLTTGTNWGILDYRTEGIYLTKTRYYSGEGNSGLWLMNPLDGTTRQVLPDSATTLALGGAAAWGEDKPMLPTIVYRYDLATGARSVWFTRPNRNVQFAGADGAGQPLVVAYSPSDPKTELWLLSGPSRGTMLYSGPSDQGPAGGFLVTEPHGTWIGGTAGLWLLLPAGQLVKVSAAPIRPLGGCH